MRDIARASGTSAGVAADFDGMQRLARDLRDLARTVGDKRSIGHSDALDVDLRGQLHRVESDWSEHRRHLQSFLTDVADSLDRVVAEYRKTDAAVAAAAT
jgi:hypothetical protein